MANATNASASASTSVAAELREPLRGSGRRESGYASDDDEGGDALGELVAGGSAHGGRAFGVPRRKTFAARTSSLYLGLGVDRAEEEEEETACACCDERRLGVECVESLDFHDVDSHWARRSRGGAISRTSARWVVAALIGFSVGALAFAIDVAISALFRGRRALFELCRTRAHIALAIFSHVGIGVALAAIAGALTTYGAPRAKGAGMHFVMAVLNGVHVPFAFDSRTLFVKCFGTIASVASGLMIGPEGPLVHIGAAIAKQFTHGSATGMADLFRSDEDRSDFISAGVAAGLAAAFGAPIGGVLFSLEEASTFWRESTTRRSLFSASIAVFVLSVCRALLAGSAASEHTAMKNPGLLRVGDFDSTYYLIEFPFYAALAATCGVISGVMTKFIVFLSEFTPKRNIHRFVQVIVVSLVTFSAFYLCAAAGSCVKPTLEEKSKWSEASVRLWCAKDEYADIGSILLANKQDVIAWVLGAPANSHTPRALLLSFVATLVTMTLAANVYVPAGMFMPTILWGALLGRLCAIVVESSLRPMGELQVNHHAYALVGATAALAGMFRATVSVVIIVLEGVGKSAFLFPLLIAVAAANIVCFSFGASLYEEQLVRAKIPFLHAKPPRSFGDSLSALDVSSRNVVSFRTIEKVGVIEEALSSTRHNGFPVTSSKNNRVLGIILRKQLLVLLSRRAFVENLVHAPRAIEEGETDESVLGGRTPDDVVSLRVAEYCKELSRVMRHYHHRSGADDAHSRRATSSTVAKLGLTDVERQRRCDLGVFMQLAPPCVSADSSARRAWDIFAKLSLRHLPVVDDDRCGALVGMITRADLVRAARKTVADDVTSRPA